jgi:hypothetical protein
LSLVLLSSSKENTQPFSLQKKSKSEFKSIAKSQIRNHATQVDRIELLHNQIPVLQIHSKPLQQKHI